MFMMERSAEQLKHLEFVQSNIMRMHEAAIFIKRFAIVIFAAGCALALNLGHASYFGFIIFVLVALWLLDAKYLQIEQNYRVLYDHVRAEPPGNAASFDLTPEKCSALPISGLKSWSSYLLYGPFIIFLLFALLANCDWIECVPVGQ